MSLKTFQIVVILSHLDNPMMPVSRTGSQGCIHHKVGVQCLHVLVKSNIVGDPEIEIFFGPRHNHISNCIFPQAEGLNLQHRFALGYAHILQELGPGSLGGQIIGWLNDPFEDKTRFSRND